jgi:hypothetical protein
MTPDRAPGAAEIGVVIASDEKVANANRNRAAMPNDWHSRALYPGQTGCRNWLSVVHEAGYPLCDPNTYDLRDHRLAAVRGHDVASLVSLGPGDGSADIDLMAGLRPRQTERAADQGPGRLIYIPVEISQPLLELAISNLRPHANIPAGVLCDFEQGERILSTTLEAHAVRPILFSMLGGTIGNLDQGEQNFFSVMRRLMRGNDAFLLDLPLAGPAWSASVDPRLNPRGYSTAFRQFLGAAIRTDRPPEHAGPRPAELPFEQWASLSHRHDEETAAEVITVTDHQTGRLVLTFRRYHWSGFLRWLRQRGFGIAYARSSVEAYFGMGVVLLTPA